MGLADAGLICPVTHALRPERKREHPGWLERTFQKTLGGLGRRWFARSSQFWRVPKWVGAHEAEMQALTDEGITATAREIRYQLHKRGLQKALVARCFALIREIAKRKMGKRHHDCQLIGAWIMLSGRIAEMNTGEGKTLTATLTAGTAAMAGIPTHVITVNDYLTERDAEEMSAVYHALGLTVGTVVHGVTPEERRAAYGCDITYATNKEIVFDYLRDQIKLGQTGQSVRLEAEYLARGKSRADELQLRGLHFGIVDEADSILVDEAKTPLIISATAGGDEETQFLREVTEVALSLEEGKHYELLKNGRMVLLTLEGRERITEEAKKRGALWSGSVRREDMVQQALVAKNGFTKDIHYVIIDGKIQIVDEYTGRIMADRSWERGLHQLIEIKEGVEPTQRKEPIARISYQRFFRRYLRLSGMTGTAEEVRDELWNVYDLACVRVPTHRPIRRVTLPTRIFVTEAEKWDALVARVIELNVKGVPVLVGTRSVEVSERLSERFTAAKLEHAVLNAKKDKEEAEIVSHAGESGRVMIATNMAGRGTDIKLGEGVRERGGLHVILTERHDAARIDRQLAGRCARQGDPGVYQAFLSLEDELLREANAGMLTGLAKAWMRLHLPGSTRFARWVFDVAQARIEDYHAFVRDQLFDSDERLRDMMSFSGKLE